MGNEKRSEPKPDDRSDNVQKLQDMTQDTIENYREAEERITLTSGEEQESIITKNERRKEAIEGFRQEMKDESNTEE